MKGITVISIAVCLCCSFGMQAFADSVSLSAHEVDWILHMPAPGFAIEYKRVVEDGRKTHFMATNKKGMGLSGSMQAGPGSGTAKDCREYYWQALKERPFKFEQVKMGEIGEIATLEYIIKEFQGAPLNQKNLFAYFVKGDYWLYFHISKSLFRPEDSPLLESMLAKAAFIQKSPNRKWDVCYKVSEERTITLTVPQTWIDDFGKEKDEFFRTITFSQGNDKESNVMLSPIPLQKGRNLDLTNPEMLRKNLEQGARKLLPNALEKKIILQELKGKAGAGFYYTLTDKAVQLPPGEYRYMTQGGITVADLLVMFTILTNDKTSPVIPQSLELISSVRP